MEKNMYAVLETKENQEKTIKILKDHSLSLVRTEELTPFTALAYFRIWPTAELIENSKKVIVLIVSGTEEAYLQYCTSPANDIGEYWYK